MDRPTRRQVLASGFALATGILLPIDVSAAPPPAPEELEVQAVTLARDAAGMGTRIALRAARAHFRRIDTAFASAPREYQRRPLHRAASTTAVLCARASRWCGLDGREWLTLAEVQASAAGDGPQLARVWLERGAAEGYAARSADCQSTAAYQLYAAALNRAGSGRGQAEIRASARCQMAWELAARGEKHNALVELDAAQREAQHAGWSQPAIDSNVGAALQKLGHTPEAELALSGAVVIAPVCRIIVLCDLARVYIASGEADGAAEALTEAFLLARTDNIDGRLSRIVAARATLPPGRPARELDEVMRGVVE